MSVSMVSLCVVVFQFGSSCLDYSKIYKKVNMKCSKLAQNAHGFVDFVSQHVFNYAAVLNLCIVRICFNGYLLTTQNYS